MTASIAVLDIFHPSVTESDRAKVMASDLYRPMLQLIKKTSQRYPAAPRLQCVAYEDSVSKTVRLGTAEGLHVVALANSPGTFRAETADHSLSRKSGSTASMSVKVNYVVNALFKPDSRAEGMLSRALDRADAAKCMNDAVMTFTRRVHHNIRSEIGRSASRLSDAISNQAVDNLLAAYAAGITEDALTPELRAAMDKLRDTKKQSVERSTVVSTRMDTMFKNDKWLVVCLADNAGYFVASYNALGAARMYVQDMVEAVPDVSMPLRYYAKLSDLPGDLYESLMARLTMMSVIARPKVGTHEFFDAQKFFPTRDLVIEGAGFVCDTRHNQYCIVTFDR